MVVEQLMILILELLNISCEALRNPRDVFEIVLLQGLELLNSSKELNELSDSAAEEIELSEYLVR